MFRQISQYIDNFLSKHQSVNVGVKVEYKLKFNKHLNSILKKTGRKANAFTRMLPQMNLTKEFFLKMNFFCYVTFQLLPFSVDVSQPYNE